MSKFLNLLYLLCYTLHFSLLLHEQLIHYLLMLSSFVLWMTMRGIHEREKNYDCAWPFVSLSSVVTHYPLRQHIIIMMMEICTPRLWIVSQVLQRKQREILPEFRHRGEKDNICNMILNLTRRVMSQDFQHIQTLKIQIIEITISCSW